MNQSLRTFWFDKRLPHVPERFLSPNWQTVIEENDLSAEDRGSLGTAKIQDVSSGEAYPLWFFELGGTAWIRHLSRLRQRGVLANETQEALLDRLETAWKRGGEDGLEALEELLEAGHQGAGLSLYAVPLLLWQDRAPDRAMHHLDLALPELGVAADADLGATVPLTYGLLHALQGDLEQAAALLSEESVPGRPESWSGLSSPEVRYHRARYIWALDRREDAEELLKEVLRADEDYLLRVLTDPAFRDPGAEDPDQPRAALVAQVVEEARSSLPSWQASRAGDRDEETRVDVLLAFEDGYGVLAATNLIRDREESRAVGTDNARRLERDARMLVEFADDLASDFPLQLGQGFGPQFTDHPESDIAHLKQLMERGTSGVLADWVRSLNHQVPHALKQATLRYMQQLFSQLQRFFELARIHSGKDDEGRHLSLGTIDLRALFRMAEQLNEMAGEVPKLPDEVNRELAFKHNRIWRDVQDAEQTWLELREKVFGQPRILVPQREKLSPIAPGDWGAVPVKVVDAKENPIPGVAVLWDVVSGSARPRKEVPYLAFNAVLTGDTGIARLPIQVPVEGKGGELSVRVPGNAETCRVSYRVEAGQQDIA